MVWPTHGTAPQFTAFQRHVIPIQTGPVAYAAPAHNIENRITIARLSDSRARWVNPKAAGPPEAPSPKPKAVVGLLALWSDCIRLMSQRVLITAGAAGIGREFARAFTANGAKVFVCDIDDNALAAIAKDIPGLIARRCDLASRAEIERMVPEAVAALGGLDVLINNAGIAGLTLPVAEYPPDDWDKVVAVNLTAMFDVSRLAIPHLKQSKAGCIINMASIAGRYGFPNRSPYAATKWGVIGLTKTLAMELGEWGIRANAIAPGAVEGDRIVRVFQGRAQISGRSLDEVKADALAASSIKAMIDPKDIAQLAVFLASDAAKSISGQVIPIDNDRQKA